MKQHWKMIVIAAVVAVLGLSVVAVAYGATKSQGSARGQAACGQLMSNPKAVAAMQALRDEHRQDMQTWYDKYGQTPDSKEAQAALKALRAEHWNEMKALFKQFGITVPKGTGPGACGTQGGMMGGGQGGMMGGGNGSCGGAGGAGCAGPSAGTQGTGCGNGMMGGSGGMMGGASY